jgi:pyridoxamine 5'-phosphate oxidase
MSDRDPIGLFHATLAKATATGMRDPNAMCLATVDAHGRPSTRMVLLKDCDTRGFVFYTNLESRKGLELVGNSEVSLTFYWRALEQQIHVRGRAEAVSESEADAYFATRPRLSQLGAWASHQSRPLPGRLSLVAEVARLEVQYLGSNVPRPPHWSGFRVVPVEMEFWVAGRFRLHDRTLFRRDGNDWRASKLFP